MDSSNTPLIQLSQVSKAFLSKSAEIQILNKADFEIRSGETIAITGASGIGKSTLLNIIGTLDTPDNGRIQFEDKDLSEFNQDDLSLFRNTKIGFVFQFHYLIQGFDALENVMMPGRIAGKNKKRVEKEAIIMLERVGLENRQTHRVEDLSGGEQQRVALARALVMKPKILLADEPTGNLDEKNSEDIHLLIQHLNQELGMTVVVVTHNQDLAAMMQRNVTIKQGQITAVKPC